jgi:lantibiotic modifying enzyme
VSFHLPAPALTRRQLLAAGLGGFAGLGWAHAAAEERRYLDAALGAARWLRSCKVAAEGATAWPVNPEQPKSVEPNLYSGVAGVVLFFLEAHHCTGDDSFLRDARDGADYLLAYLARDRKALDPGLYTGAAGIGFCLEQTYKATRAQKYRSGADRCLDALTKQARKSGDGVAWNDSNDIIAGSAGIGLALLAAAQERDDAGLRDLASRAGRRLIELGKPEHGGLKWQAAASYPKLMPNFSHGTAGVGYFLARLHQVTKEKAFLEATLAGAKYLQAVADTAGGVCRVFHHEPDGKDLYYLGWCHGPTGTARLFYRLHQATGERVWMDWVHKCARALLDSGIPQKQTEGFWNNVGQCCGTAGVAQFFLDLHRVTREDRYLKFCERLAADVLSRASTKDGRLSWRHAEYRVKPDEVAAQTGYMQGAAGIGTFLLRLDAFKQGKTTRITLPDSPF